MLVLPLPCLAFALGCRRRRSMLVVVVLPLTPLPRPRSRLVSSCNARGRRRHRCQCLTLMRPRSSCGRAVVAATTASHSAQGRSPRLAIPGLTRFDSCYRALLAALSPRAMQRWARADGGDLTRGVGRGGGRPLALWNARQTGLTRAGSAAVPCGLAASLSEVAHFLERAFPPPLAKRTPTQQRWGPFFFPSGSLKRGQQTALRLQQSSHPLPFAQSTAGQLSPPLVAPNEARASSGWTCKS